MRMLAAGHKRTQRQKPAQIADGVEPADGLIAGSAVFLARHGRHVVDANRRGAVHIPIAADGARHVGLPVVVEGLVEARLRAGNVAEVDEENFPLPKCSMHS